MTVSLLTGDAEAMLEALPAGVVHATITSPPYYGLREYHADGQIGREDTPHAYVDRLVAVFRGVRRALRDDGSLWVVIGDSYATQGGAGNQGATGQRANRRFTAAGNSAKGVPGGMKPKDLIGIPWMLAFALRDDGWYLREEIIWMKNSCMPESVRDRCTRQHETIFHLTKSASYYHDWFAIAEPAQSDHPSGNGYKRDARLSYQDKDGARGDEKQWSGVGGMRNARSVWTINPEPFESQMCLACGTYYRGADYRRLPVIADDNRRRQCQCGATEQWSSHFAVFPTRLASRMIRASTPDGGCCPRCDTPMDRIIAEGAPDAAWQAASGADSTGDYVGTSREGFAASGAQNASATKARILAGMRRKETAGWRRICSCPDDGRAAQPALVLDPFSGAGTTALCASRLGRHAVGVDLNPDYNHMAEARLRDTEAKCLDGDGSRL